MTTTSVMMRKRTTRRMMTLCEPRVRVGIGGTGDGAATPTGLQTVS